MRFDQCQRGEALRHAGPDQRAILPAIRHHRPIRQAAVHALHHRRLCHRRRRARHDRRDDHRDDAQDHEKPANKRDANHNLFLHRLIPLANWARFTFPRHGFSGRARRKDRDSGIDPHSYRGQEASGSTLAFYTAALVEPFVSRVGESPNEAVADIINGMIKIKLFRALRKLSTRHAPQTPDPEAYAGCD